MISQKTKEILENLTVAASEIESWVGFSNPRKLFF
jgi:hypothetical protein